MVPGATIFVLLGTPLGASSVGWEFGAHYPNWAVPVLKLVDGDPGLGGHGISPVPKESPPNVHGE